VSVELRVAAAEESVTVSGASSLVTRNLQSDGPIVAGVKMAARRSAARS
jgi:hypothetical protein